MTVDDMISDFLASFPAGFGPMSNGIPEEINDVETRRPSSAPRASVSYSEGNTRRIRRAP